MKHVVQKYVIRIIATLVVLISSIVLISFIIYPSDYVLRLLRWGDADVFDHLKFPKHNINSAAPTFYFKKSLNEAGVCTLFEKSSIIDNLDKFLAKTRTQAFIVILNDTILYEKYFSGANRDTIVTSFSVAKSFTSAIIGIAIKEGHIKSASDPITKYLPELKKRDPAFSKISIRDLLMMSSGIRYEEFPFLNGDDAKTYYYPDLRNLALNQTKIIDPPAKYFHYNNYHPLLLGLIIERATGTTVAAYLQEKIWKPLGMEYTASWSTDSQSTQFEKMESGINARAIDFAKFGRLYLKKGNWHGKQIIPAHWISESIEKDQSTDDNVYYPNDFIFKSGKGYYKYMWWGLLRNGKDFDFAALGNHGQFIYISPSQNLIIVRNGEKYGVSSLEWMNLFYGFAGKVDVLLSQEHEK
ncbi:MAG: serine hydrolase [Deltaproteobacteria bacterium]|nr:serine hydrolase [Deltaproteobacteria bacterium]